MTVPQIKVKIHRRPQIKLKVLPRFPANVQSGTAIAVTRNAGTYTFDLDYNDIQITPTIPSLDMPNSYNLVWNQDQRTYYKVPFALQATSGVASIDGHTGALDIGAGLQFTGETLEVDVATEAEALAGTSNDVLMTPLRVAQVTARTFDTLALAVAATIPAGVKGLRLYGYATAGDAPVADYVRVAAQPSHAGKLQSTDRFLPNGSTDSTNGGWWEIRTSLLDSRMLGVHLSASDCLTAFQAFIDCASAIVAQAVVHSGAVYDFPSGSVDLPAGLDLYMVGATLRRTVDIDPGIPLLQAIGTSGSPIIRGRITGGLFKYTPTTTAHTITNNTALWLVFCNSWHVSEIKVEGAFYVGARYDDCRDSTLSKSEFWGVYNRAIYIAATFYTENVHVSDCLCDGFAFGTTTPLTNHIVNTNGYGTGTGRNVTFTNVEARNGITSPSGEGFAFADRINNQKAVNCRAVNCPTGFYITEGNGQINQNVQLINCEADTCPTGYLLVGCFNTSVVGCRSMGHSTVGIIVTNGGGHVIANNVISGSGTGSGDGISFTGTAGGITLNGNSVSNNAGTGFKSASTCSSIVGRGNYTVLNGTATNMLGVSGIDFPTAASSGNLIL